MTMRVHYCAGCGKKIASLHTVIPGRTENRALRYHFKCKPDDEPVEITAQTDESETQ